MRKTGSLYTFYITINSRDGRNTTIKQDSTCARLAVRAVMLKTRLDHVSGIQCSEGIPKTQAERDKKMRQKQAAKARQKKLREERIMVTDGVRSLGNLHEYNQSKDNPEE